MKLKCKRASASEAGGEMFQVLFEVNPEQEYGPYVLIQRAWLEAEEGAASPYYVETHEECLIGQYATLEEELSKNLLILRLPPPTDETIEIDFATSERGFQEIRHVLDIIPQRDLGEESNMDRD